MNTETTTGTVASPAIITRLPPMEQLQRDLEFHPHWISLRDAGEEHLKKIAEGGKKKTPFNSIVTREARGDRFANPTLIVIKPGFNFRDLNTKYNFDGIKELAQMVAADGVRVPIKIATEQNGSGTFAEDGHRRMAALKYAIVHLNGDIMDVPVRPGDVKANDREQVMSQFMDNTGQRPTPFETAGIFSRLVAKGMTEEELARRTGYGKSRVTSLLDMASVPSALQMIQQNADLRISDSMIHLMWRANGKDEGKTLADLEFAINRAKEKGSEKVLPKHLSDAANRLYNGSLSKPARSVLPVIPAPEEAPAAEAKEEGSAETVETKDTSLVVGSEAPPAEKDNDNEATTEAARPSDGVEEAPPPPPEASTAPVSTTATTPRPARQEAAPSPGPSAHTPKPADNFNKNMALLHFFKHHVRFLPMEEGDTTRKFEIVDPDVKNEVWTAILHSLNLN